MRRGFVVRNRSQIRRFLACLLPEWTLGKVVSILEVRVAIYRKFVGLLIILIISLISLIRISIGLNWNAFNCITQRKTLSSEWSLCIRHHIFSLIGFYRNYWIFMPNGNYRPPIKCDPLSRQVTTASQHLRGFSVLYFHVLSIFQTFLRLPPHPSSHQ